MRALLAGLLLIPSLAWGQSAAPIRPDTSLTPGVVVTIDAAKVCKPGYAKTQRHTPQSVKDTAYGEYGIASHKAGDFEVDHLISLELGGADVIGNLWPQSYKTKPWNAHVKDRLENWLHREVCAGRMKLSDAQDEIRTDWIASYQKHLGAGHP